MKLLPEIDATSGEFVPVKLPACLFTAGLLLSLTLPALAEKIEGTKSAPIQAQQNVILLHFFTVLNYIAGIAIISALVLCGIWFFQRKGDGEEEGGGESTVGADVEPTATVTEPSTSDATTAPSASSPSGPEAAKPAEPKPEETTAEEAKPEEPKPDESRK